MKLGQIISHLEELAPPMYQESYDNSGLIVGNREMVITKAVICLDSTPDVIQEAISKGANLVIAHHPIVFKGLKRFNGSNYVERAVITAIKHDIAIYAIHTNLDNVRAGVNEAISSKIGLIEKKILSPKSNVLKKLVFYCPQSAANGVLDAIYSAGGGKIGNYEECSFSSLGTGSFKPVKGANPAEGQLNVTSQVEESRVEVLVEAPMLNKVLKALIDSHPYEEVAHEVYDVLNKNKQVGSGMIGELEGEMELEDFLSLVKEKFNVGCIKYTDYKKPVKTVAVCGGSGGFLLNVAKQLKTDVFITSDYKYHEFFDAEGEICIMDIGHFESEQFTMELIKDYLINKFPKFAADLTDVNTNPVKYY